MADEFAKWFVLFFYGFGMWAMTVGLLLCFLGRRMFRSLLGFLGFGIGVGLGYWLFVVVLQVTLTWKIAAMLVAMGLIAAVMLMLWFFIALMTFGFQLGAILVGVPTILLLSLLGIEGQGIALLAALVGGFVGVVLAIKYREALIVLLTAFNGASLATIGLAWVVAGIHFSADVLRNDPSVIAQWSWLKAALPIFTLLLGIAGCCVQFSAARKEKSP